MHARAQGVELLGEMAGSGYAQTPLLVRRGDGQTIQLTPLLYRVLEAIDGNRSNLEIAWDVARATDKVLSASEVDYLVEEKLRPLGLVTDEHGNEPVNPERTNPLLALKLRFVVTNPKVTNRITAPFALLFHPAIALPVVAAFLAITGWVLFTKGLGSAVHQTIYDPKFLVLTFVLTIASAGFHEFGHAAAAKYGGATPGAMGAAIYLVWPAFYTDVTDSYRLDRRGRLRVDVGGLYFNAIFAVATFGAWVATRHDSLLVMVPIQLFQMVRQLLPFVRFDGYHILADLTGVPDLFSRIVPTLRGLLPSHWHDPETKVLKPWARATVTIWTLAVIPALAACLVLMILGLPRLLATAHQSLELQFAVLQEQWTDGDTTNVVARVLSIVAIALPPLSAIYLLTRVTHRTSRRMWNAAAKYPAAQGALAVGFGSVVAFAAMALWPGGQYEPVQADERAAIGDGFAIMPSRLIRSIQPDVIDAAFPAAQRLRATLTSTTADADGRELDRTSATPDDLAATEPSLHDQIPAGPGAATGSASGDPWPFPFDPPPAPRAQDNFAVAVNTTDARHVADVSADFQWLGEARVDQRNRSYAIAQCVDCTTIAAAFQVVVASDRSRTVIPENSAISVNHECTSCITHSVAVQLVVTTFETPPDAVRNAVHARYAAVKALERRATSISSGELRSQFLDAKADILALLAPYAVRTETDTDAQGDQVTPPPPETTATTATTDPETQATDQPSTEQPTSTTSTTGQQTSGSSSTTAPSTSTTERQDQDNTTSTSAPESPTSTTVPPDQNPTTSDTTPSS